MSAPRSFPGFPTGARATLIPNVFFSDLLPAIEDCAELLVTTYVFFALGRKRPAERWLTTAELAADRGLRRALARLPGGPDAALARGLALALARGTLVRAGVGDETRYTLNSPAWRRSPPPDAAAIAETVAPVAAEPPPTIYALYEENIGTISPLLAEELRAAESEYPPIWIEDAFREAVGRNRRNWRYIARILERWRDEGRHDATVGRDPEARRDLAGRYRGLVRR